MVSSLSINQFRDKIKKLEKENEELKNKLQESINTNVTEVKTINELSEKLDASSELIYSFTTNTRLHIEFVDWCFSDENKNLPVKDKIELWLNERINKR